MSSRSIVSLSIALTIIAALWLWFGSGTTLPAIASTPPVETVRIHDKAWIESLLAGDRIEIYPDTGEPLEGRAPTAIWQSLGRLEEHDLARARATLSLDDSYQSVLRAEQKAESGSASDYVDFLQQLAFHEKTKVALRMIDRGDYITTTCYASLPSVPDNYLEMYLACFASVGGTRVDVRFLMNKDSYPDLAQAWQVWIEANTALVQDEAERFNQLPLEIRRRRIEAHFLATDRLRGAGAAGDKAELRAQIIPTKFRVDRIRYMLSVRQQVTR